MKTWSHIHAGTHSHTHPLTLNRQCTRSITCSFAIHLLAHIDNSLTHSLTLTMHSLTHSLTLARLRGAAQWNGKALVQQHHLRSHHRRLVGGSSPHCGAVLWRWPVLVYHDSESGALRTVFSYYVGVVYDNFITTRSQWS